MKYFVNRGKLMKKEDYCMYIKKLEAYNITYSVKALNGNINLYFNIANFLEKVNVDKHDVYKVKTSIDDNPCTQKDIDKFLDKYNQDFEMSVVFTTRDRSYVNKEIKIYII